MWQSVQRHKIVSDGSSPRAHSSPGLPRERGRGRHSPRPAIGDPTCVGCSGTPSFTPRGVFPATEIHQVGRPPANLGSCALL